MQFCSNILVLAPSRIRFFFLVVCEVTISCFHSPMVWRRPQQCRSNRSVCPQGCKSWLLHAMRGHLWVVCCLFQEQVSVEVCLQFGAWELFYELSQTELLRATETRSQTCLYFSWDSESTRVNRGLFFWRNQYLPDINVIAVQPMQWLNFLFVLYHICNLSLLETLINSLLVYLFRLLGAVTVHVPLGRYMHLCPGSYDRLSLLMTVKTTTSVLPSERSSTEFSCRSESQMSPLGLIVASRETELLSFQSLGGG